MDQVEALTAHLQVQVIRQAGEKAQEPGLFQPCPVVEQLPVGGHTAVLPPELPGAELVVRTQGTQAHLLVVAQEHGHVGRVHDLLEGVQAQGAPVDNVAQNVQVVGVGKADQLQQLLKLVQLAVDV